MALEENNQELELAERLYTNGINGSTGEYLTPPMSGEDLVRLILGENPEEDYENYDKLKDRATQEEVHFGVTFGIDCTKLDQTGWGVIYAPGIGDEVKEALKPLIDWRKGQAGPLFQGMSISASPAAISSSTMIPASPARPNRRRCPTTCCW